MEGEANKNETKVETKLTAFRRGNRSGAAGNNDRNTDQSNLDGNSGRSGAGGSRVDGTGEANRDTGIDSSHLDTEQSSGQSSERVEPNPRTAEPSGIVEDGSSGTGGSARSQYGIEPRRPNESTDEYNKRYRREYKRIKRNEAKGNVTQHQEIAVNDEEESEFTITVETPAFTEPTVTRGSKPKAERKAAPKRGKYKEPSKEQQSQTAEQLKQIYGTMDILVGGAMGMAGKPYPQGMLQLDETKAEQMGRALAQMNVNFPEWANKINSVSAPAVFFGLLITDIGMKGLALYGLAKQPSQKPVNGHLIAASQQPRTPSE